MTTPPAKKVTLTSKLIASAGLGRPTPEGNFSDIELRLLRIIGEVYATHLAHSRMISRDGELAPVNRWIAETTAQNAFAAAVEIERLLRNVTDNLITREDEK